ncbi:chemotaxis protein CheW [Brucepastera parasyntrophica]|uniref:chemotaxis protein CheW n=1 Tax=Brucepastera parasyntrophica TaxID=2880008 RepID=UPI00210CD4FD|nr:chemotaxis protein CheW [Brucepastera parasyntrophica]ULQ58918.1 chemotaxis protein CheW [Brucepastera parasyntrophica]
MDEITGNDINQYLTFYMADEIYGVSVANVKEVLSVSRITRVPRMPDYMSGVINLRGNVIPVIDLRLKFGLGPTPITEDTNIIVTEAVYLADEEDSESLVVGIFTDAVQKVVTIEPDQIEPPPKMYSSIDSSFIIGMGKVDQMFIIILNLEKTLSQQELLSFALGRNREAADNG